MTAVERLAPPTLPPVDLDGADAFVWEAQAHELRPVAEVARVPLALLVGIFGTRPGVNRLMALGAQAAQSEGPPPAEVAEEIQGLQARLKIYARTSLAFLAVAVLAMATARYW